MILSYLELVPWFTAAGGCGAACVASIVSPLPKIAKTPLTVLSGGLAVLCVGVIIGKDVEGLRVAELERENEKLVILLNDLNDTYQKQTQDLVDRQVVETQLRETVLTYQLELQNGSTSACASDSVYDDRLRSILDGLPTD